MRKFMLIFLALVLILGQASCSKGGEEEVIDQEPEKEVVEGREKIFELALGEGSASLDLLDEMGVYLVAPPGALNEEAILSLISSEDFPRPPADSARLLGSIIDLNFPGDVKRFEEPLLLKFQLDQDLWEAFENKGNLHLAYYDGSDWIYMEPSEIHENGGTFGLEIYHCSFFAPAEPTKEELERMVAREMAVNTVMVDRDSQLRKTTEELVKSVMGPGVDKSFLRDVVEGIMDQNTFTKLAKDLVNNHMEEAEEEFIGSYTQVVAGKLHAHAQTMSNNLGELGENLGLVGAYGTSAGLIDEGDYYGAAKELAQGVIGTTKLGKLLTSAVKVTKRQVARWKSEEIEAAYKIYIEGKEPSLPFWGYGSIEAGDFDEIWSQMRGISRQIIIDAVEDFKEDKEREPTEDEKKQIESEARAVLKREFEERRDKETDIAKEEQRSLDFIKIVEEGNLLEPNRFGYDPWESTYKDRLREIFELRNKVLEDTKRRMNFRGDDSDSEINVYTVSILIGEYLSKGEEGYREALIERGLIDEPPSLDSRDVLEDSLSGTWNLVAYLVYEIDNEALDDMEIEAEPVLDLVLSFSGGTGSMSVDGYSTGLDISGDSFSGALSASFFGLKISNVLTGSASVNSGQISIAGDLKGYIDGTHVSTHNWSGQRALPEVIYIDDIPVLTGN